jgi:hypothetical protein
MLEFVDEVRGWVEEMGYRKDVYLTKVRPHKVDGVPQLRAEVKRKDGKRGGFRRVGWAAGHACHWIGNCSGVKRCYSVEVQCTHTDMELM